MNRLAGLRVAVTRPLQEDDPLVGALAAGGAQPVVIPLVDIVDAEDPTPLLQAAARLRDYDWVVFTSANAVRCLAQAQARTGMAAVELPRIAAVGPATAAAAAAILGREPDAVPDRFTGAHLTAAMSRVAPLEGRRVLWPRALEAREELPTDLLAAGAQLEAPVAYRTVPQPEAARRLAALVASGDLDVITLTSPSAVACLAEALVHPGAALIAVIGPTTAAAAAAAGLPVHIMPEVHTIDALVAALVARAGSAQGDRE